MLQNLSAGPAIASLGCTLGTDADPVMSYQVEPAFVNATVRFSEFTSAGGCASVYCRAQWLALIRMLFALKSENAGLTSMCRGQSREVCI